MSQSIHMTREDFFAKWREECREFFELLPTIERTRDAGVSVKTDGPRAIAAQRVRRGSLLIDLLNDGTLHVEGLEWDPGKLDGARRGGKATKRRRTGETA